MIGKYEPSVKQSKKIADALADSLDNLVEEEVISKFDKRT
jgi:hypothetical protein